MYTWEAVLWAMVKDKPMVMGVLVQAQPMLNEQHDVTFLWDMV